MVKIDLITGFLGAGKTTFIRKYAEHLISLGLKVGILENDYGAVNVDMMLLDDLRGDKCELEMIAGGCCNDCHRRRFKTKLIAMAMQGYDRIIVEPSGVYDVDEFFDVLYEEPLDRWYEKGSVISIVDSNLKIDLSEASRYLLMSQTSSAGMIVFSKIAQDDIGNICAQNCKEIIKRLNCMMDEFNCNVRINGQYIYKPFADITSDDYLAIMNCSYHSSDHIKMHVEDEDFFSSVYFMDNNISPDKVKSASKELFNNSSAGNIIRIKGFVKSGDQWMQINITKEHSEYKLSDAGQDVLIIIGENLNEELIKASLT